jgi:hypothetical protein
VTIAFSAILSPGAEILSSISDVTPRSPFNTPAYASALSAGSAEPCALQLVSDNNSVVGGCLAALAGGRWNRRLEIFSAPTLPSPSEFWDGVTEFCRQQKVCDLDVQTFASDSPGMPSSADAISTRRRIEYLLDLSEPELFNAFSKNHKRSIRKAKKADLTFTQSTSFDDYQTHIRLMESSVTRRGDRGESVILPQANDFDFRLLSHGAAELFQARSDAEVLASILILTSKTCGYYHSAGTSPEGMKSGASPFLISEVASALASSGRDWLNLGGADPEAEGLRRFKKGFGAQEIHLPAGVYSMIPSFERTFRTMARSVKNAPGYVLGTIRRRKPQTS